MSSWDKYQERIRVSGESLRDVSHTRAARRLKDKIPNSLSFKTVEINGITQNVSIISTDDMNIKKIISMPGEELEHGGYVNWKNFKWLITELDADDELYQKGVMRQCNYLLKWIDIDGNIIEKWCIVEDGTKYLIGEKSADMMAIGDARIAITIGKDNDTTRLKRGMRFLVDDIIDENPSAYQITKSNKLYNIFEGKGVYRFILNEVNLTDNDNTDLMIADYYSWKPKIPLDTDHVNVDKSIDEIVDEAKQKIEEDNFDNEGVWI